MQDMHALIICSVWHRRLQALPSKKLIEEKKITGTVKVFGCPAEEGEAEKRYMVRAGLFDDVDAVLHWHPGMITR